MLLVFLTLYKLGILLYRVVPVLLAVGVHLVVQ